MWLFCSSYWCLHVLADFDDVILGSCWLNTGFSENLDMKCRPHTVEFCWPQKFSVCIAYNHNFCPSSFKAYTIRKAGNIDFFLPFFFLIHHFDSLYKNSCLFHPSVYIYLSGNSNWVANRLNLRHCYNHRQARTAHSLSNWWNTFISHAFMSCTVFVWCKCMHVFSLACGGVVLK